ncbi:tetQ family GTPase, putative [Plasmodium gallinaceum]|uniref:TetQ family GTPase, putative n=1 Tax=Plasmodium gallinaceum TaxID=5849 RepID=A0A1J1GX01_PLAGA|nr:tetQ family GTPase, putative [Plasmodium gallinaceum]CRG96991.1 tetQ family GTPase, putative [Plasmodium gallinaceum]
MLKKVLTTKNIFLKYNKRFSLHEVVNLGILAHIDAGKTTISEDILYNANEIKIKGNINDQNTQLDFLKQERERGITIKTAYSCFEWNNVKVNLIDTPGHVDFSNETFLSLCVSDKCVIVVDAKEGLQIQTINIFRYIKENIPIFFFLNKMDIYEADLDYNFTSIRNNLSKKCLLITYPIYENKKLKYILDIPSMILYFYPEVKYGQKFVYKGIPLEGILKQSKNKNLDKHFYFIQSCKDISEEYKNENEKILHILNDDIINYIIKKREEIVEVLCDLDSEIEYKYLNNLQLTYKDIKNSLSENINKKYIFPAFSGSALNSYGVHLLLDYVTYTSKTDDYSNIIVDSSNIINQNKHILHDKHKYIGNIEEIIDKNNNKGTIKNKDDIRSCTTVSNKNFSIINEINNNVKPLNDTINKKYAMNFYKTIIFIFKLVSEKNGYNTFCKVFKGKLTNNSMLCNIRNNKNEKVKNIYKVKADRYIITKELTTNDIGMVRGFENILVCDILGEKEEKTNEEETLRKKERYYKEENKIKEEYEINSDDYYKRKNNLQINETNYYNEIYKLMKGQIKNKELWYFLKSYKKRISKNIIVCTCAIEPKDYKKEKELKNILKQICLEDNSIHTYVDKNNKLIIGSIGILNIEVTLEKIKSDYNIDIKTSDVEIVCKEYILGNYENEIEKQMKVGSNYSSIVIGLSIKEKEFVDVANYIQNILKYDNVSQFLTLNKKKECSSKNSSICGEEKEENYDSIKNNYTTNNFKEYDTNVEIHMNDFSKNSDTNNIHYNKKKIEINSNSDTSEKVRNLKKENSLHFHFSCYNNLKGKLNSEHYFKKTFNSKNKMKILEEKNGGDEGDINEIDDEKINDEHIDDEEINDENIDDEEISEYLLNLNYENLFQSNVTIDKNVQLYVEELKKINKKKKNFYDEILKSCIISLKNCLSNGYRTNANIINTEIIITKLKIFDDSTIAVAKYACNDLYYKMIRNANIQIAHPISLLHIQTNESFVGIIVKDLIQNRKGNVIQIMKNKQQDDFKIMKIIAIMPVKYTHNYASVLRSISSGHANFFMTFCGYNKC